MPVRAGKQYTIRGIPREVDQALRRKARERRVSLNRLLVDELTQPSGTAAERRYRSLEQFAGAWKEDPEFDRVLDEQRRIDWSAWKWA
jgi:hypothetical protein